MDQHYDATERAILAERTRWAGTYATAYANDNGVRAIVRAPRAGHHEYGGQWYAVLVDGREVGRFAEWGAVRECLSAVLGHGFTLTR